MKKATAGFVPADGLIFEVEADQAGRATTTPMMETTIRISEASLGRARAFRWFRSSCLFCTTASGYPVNAANARRDCHEKFLWMYCSGRRISVGTTSKEKTKYGRRTRDRPRDIPAERRHAAKQLSPRFGQGEQSAADAGTASGCSFSRLLLNQKMDRGAGSVPFQSSPPALLCSSARASRTRPGR